MRLEAHGVGVELLLDKVGGGLGVLRGDGVLVALAALVAELGVVVTLPAGVLGVLGVLLLRLPRGGDGVARGVAEHALLAAAPARVLVVELLASKDDVGKVLEGDGEVKLVADVVAGFTRGPRHALALDDERVVHHAPLLAGHALDLLPGHRKVEAGVGGDSHRGLLEFLLLSDRVTAVRRLGGHKLLRDVAPASGQVTDAAAHLLVVDELVPAPLKSLPALDQLRRGTLDVVHLGLGVGDGPLRAFVAELGVLREVHAEGLIGHLLGVGLDGVQALHGVVHDGAEIRLHKRGDIRELIVVVDDKLEKDARLVRVVGHEVGLGLEPALVERPDGVLVLAVGWARPLGDDVDDGGALGHVPLVVHGGDDDELGGPSVGDGAGALSLRREHGLAVEIDLAGPVEHGHLVRAARRLLDLLLGRRLAGLGFAVVRALRGGSLAVGVVAFGAEGGGDAGFDGCDDRVGVPGGLAAVLIVEGSRPGVVDGRGDLVGINLDVSLERILEGDGDDAGLVGLGERGDLVVGRDAVALALARSGVEREGHVLVHEVLGVGGHVVIGSDGGVRDHRRGHHARDEDAGGGSLR